MTPQYTSLEAHILEHLAAIFGASTGLEPAPSDTMVTFRFATTARRSKRGYAGTLTMHFHGDKLAGLNRSYEHEQAVADRLSGSQSANFAVSSCNFAGRDDFSDPETGEFIAVEATYDVEYARRG